MSIVPFTSEQSEPSERYYEHEKLKQFLMSWKRFSTFLPVEFQVLPTFLKIVVLYVVLNVFSQWTFLTRKPSSRAVPAHPQFFPTLNVLFFIVKIDLQTLR